jgi:chromate transporter
MTEYNVNKGKEPLWAIFLVFLRLGLTAFGGPIAHLGYFREEFVHKRHWLNERSYADLVSLCQFLPGPASSQVGIALGLSRKGYLGAVAAWLGFTLPSALILILFALTISSQYAEIPVGALHGLKVVTVAVVAQAVWVMAKTLCRGVKQLVIMLAAACVALLIPSPLGQFGIISVAGLVGLVLFDPRPTSAHESLPIHISHQAGLIFISIFFGLLLTLPFLLDRFSNQTIYEINAFYRSGALVFGGGHVVLPLLQASVVPQGLVSNDTFLAGYGAAQAIPGPLFSFAAFLGASMNVTPTGWLGGLICLLAIFTPSFLLVFGALPFWERLRHQLKAQSALTGINAAVVGILLAALYDPVWTSAIKLPQDFGMAMIAFVALVFLKAPPWLMVIFCAFTGWVLSKTT